MSRHDIYIVEVTKCPIAGPASQRPHSQRSSSTHHPFGAHSPGGHPGYRRSPADRGPCAVGSERGNGEGGVVVGGCSSGPLRQHRGPPFCADMPFACACRAPQPRRTYPCWRPQYSAVFFIGGVCLKDGSVEEPTATSSTSLRWRQRCSLRSTPHQFGTILQEAQGGEDGWLDTNVWV